MMMGQYSFLNLIEVNDAEVGDHFLCGDSGQLTLSTSLMFIVYAVAAAVAAAASAAVRRSL